MSFLPIVDRELRAASRRASTFWLRFFAALVVLVVWVVLLVGTQRMTPAQLSQHIIVMLGSLTLGFCMLAGVFLTSDCISAEKREGTLGLLFLTDLKGFDVVLGKLVATSVHAFFGLLAIMPIVGLSLMMGGVTGGEFARLVLVFVLTLFASLAAGLFVSTVSRHAMRAMAGAFILVVFFGGILPTVWWSHATLFNNPIFDFLLVPSPPYLFRKALDSSYSLRMGAQEFWQSAGIIFSLALAAIVSACLALPRVWQTGEGRRWFPTPRRAARHPARAVRIGLAQNANPFAWLASRDFSARLVSSRILAPLVALCLVLLLASLVGKRNIPAFIACFLTAFGLHLMLKIFIAMEAGRRLNEDRQSGALELLLVTDLPISAIIVGQWAALKAHFRRPLILLVGLNGALVLATLLFPTTLKMDGKDQIIFCELFLGGIALLWADFHALGWLGMWRGLVRHNQRAVVGTILKVMGIPWALIVLFITTQPRASETEIFLMFATWIATGLIIDAVIAVTARRRIAEHFRAAAAGTYQARSRFKVA